MSCCSPGFDGALRWVMVDRVGTYTPRCSSAAYGLIGIESPGASGSHREPEAGPSPLSKFREAAGLVDTPCARPARVRSSARESGSGKALIVVLVSLALLAAGGVTWFATRGSPGGIHEPAHVSGRGHSGRREASRLQSRVPGFAWRYAPIRGVSFTGRHSEPVFQAMSCPTQLECWVVGTYYATSVRARSRRYHGSLIPNNGVLILHTSDGGATWAAVRPTKGLGLDHHGVLYRIACPDALHCWAVGKLHSTLTGRPFILATSNGGRSWRYQAFPKGILAIPRLSRAAVARFGPIDNSLYWTALQCPTDSTCWASLMKYVTVSSPSFHFHDYVLHTTDGGDSWVVQTPVREPVSVLQAAWLEEAPGKYRTWQVAGSSPGHTVLCSAQGTCWTTGLVSFVNGKLQLPLVLRTTDGGLTWSPSIVAAFASSQPNADQLMSVVVASGNGSVSCPSRTECLAGGVGFTVTPNHPGIRHATCHGGCAVTVATTNGGATWIVQNPPPKVPDDNGVQAIYCTSLLACTERIAGFGLYGPASVSFFTTDNGGITWSEEPLDQEIGRGHMLSRSTGLFSLVCPGTRDCWAIALTRDLTRSVLFHTSG